MKVLTAPGVGLDQPPQVLAALLDVPAVELQHHGRVTVAQQARHSPGGRAVLREIGGLRLPPVALTEDGRPRR